MRLGGGRENRSYLRCEIYFKKLEFFYAIKIRDKNRNPLRKKLALFFIPKLIFKLMGTSPTKNIKSKLIRNVKKREYLYLTILYRYEEIV